MSIDFEYAAKMADRFNKLFTAGSDLSKLASLVFPTSESLATELANLESEINKDFTKLFNEQQLQNYKTDWDACTTAMNNAYDHLTDCLTVLKGMPVNPQEGSDPTVNPNNHSECTFSHWCDHEVYSSHSHGALTQTKQCLTALAQAFTNDSVDLNGVAIYDKILEYSQMNQSYGRLGTDTRWQSMTRLMQHVYTLVAGLTYTYESCRKLLAALDPPETNPKTYGDIHINSLFGSYDSSVSTAVWPLFKTFFDNYLSGTMADQLLLSAMSPSQYPGTQTSSKVYFPTEPSSNPSSTPFPRSYFWAAPVSINAENPTAFFTSINFFQPPKYTDKGIKNQVANGMVNPIFALQGTTGSLNNDLQVVPATPGLYPANDDLSQSTQWFYETGGNYITNKWMPIHHLTSNTCQIKFPTPPATSSNNHLRVVTGFQIVVVASTSTPGNWDLAVAVQYGEIDLGSSGYVKGQYARVVTLLNNGDYISPSATVSLPIHETTALSPAGSFDINSTTNDPVNLGNIVTNISLGTIYNQSLQNAPIVQMAPSFCKADVMQPSKNLVNPSGTPSS